jgi:hypothetical protein
MASGEATPGASWRRVMRKARRQSSPEGFLPLRPVLAWATISGQAMGTFILNGCSASVMSAW